MVHANTAQPYQHTVLRIDFRETEDGSCQHHTTQHSITNLMVVFIKCAVFCYPVAPRVNFSGEIIKYF